MQVLKKLTYILLLVSSSQDSIMIWCVYYLMCVCDRILEVFKTVYGTQTEKNVSVNKMRVKRNVTPFQCNSRNYIQHNIIVFAILISSISIQLNTLTKYILLNDSTESKLLLHINCWNLKPFKCVSAKCQIRCLLLKIHQPLSENYVWLFQTYNAGYFKQTMLILIHHEDIQWPTDCYWIM